MKVCGNQGIALRPIDQYLNHGRSNATRITVSSSMSSMNAGVPYWYSSCVLFTYINENFKTRFSWWREGHNSRKEFIAKKHKYKERRTRTSGINLFFTPVEDTNENVEAPRRIDIRKRLVAGSFQAPCDHATLFRRIGSVYFRQ